MANLKTKIKNIKKRLEKKALREPRTRSQKIDRLNYDRVKDIWRRRYEGK